MLIKHSSIYLIAKTLPALVTFVALSVYTHLLTPDEYGTYALILTSATLLNAIFVNWIPAGTLRFWSNNNYSDSEFITTIVHIYVKIFLFLLIPLSIVTFYYWDTGMIGMLLIAFCYSLVIALYTITQYLLSSQILPEQYAKFTILGSILSLSFGGFLAYQGFEALGVIIGAIIGLTLPSLVMYKYTWAHYQKGKYRKGLFKKLLVYGVPIGSAFIFEEITKSADRFMLASYHGKSQAGMYVAGYDISGNSVLMLMAAVNTAAYPLIIKLLEHEGKEAAFEYFKKYVVLLIGISIPGVAGLLLVGPNLIHLVIGQEYQQVVTSLLPWMTLALFLAGLQAFYFDLAFQLGHYTMGIVKIGVFIATFNIGLNYLFIPTMGITGAAIATISSFGLGAILSVIFGNRYFPLPFPLKEFTKIILATLIMVLCLWGLKDDFGWLQLVIQLVIGILSYLSMVVIFNVLEVRDNIKVMIAKRKISS